MVRICCEPYTNTLYNGHFELFPFELSDFQKYAIESIVDGNNCLVTAHTGSGKTLPAEFALQHFVEQGKKVVYTSPIKALSNQKFYEFQNKYPHISFGLFTGDIKTNPEADVLIMTTEILMNKLFLKDQQIKTQMDPGTTNCKQNGHSKKQQKTSVQKVVNVTKVVSNWGPRGPPKFNQIVTIFAPCCSPGPQWARSRPGVQKRSPKSSKRSQKASKR